MISDKMAAAINGQINMELFSGYIYLSMAQYFEAEGLQGLATWNKGQTMEEFAHARRFMDFVNERGGKVVLQAIDGPKTEWTSPLEAFGDVYAHECKVSGLINDLVDLALEERDHAAHAFFQWFVSEQVEEEATAQGILDKLRLAGDSGSGLFMIDQELGARAFPANVWVNPGQ